MKKSIICSALVALTAALSAPQTAYAAHLIDDQCKGMALNDTNLTDGGNWPLKKGAVIGIDSADASGQLLFVSHLGSYLLSDMKLLNCTVSPIVTHNEPNNSYDWRRLYPIPSKFTPEQLEVMSLEPAFSLTTNASTYRWWASAYVTGSPLCRSSIDDFLAIAVPGGAATSRSDAALTKADGVCKAEFKLPEGVSGDQSQTVRDVPLAPPTPPTPPAPQVDARAQLEQTCKLVWSSAMMEPGHGGNFFSSLGYANGAKAACLQGQPYRQR